MFSESAAKIINVLKFNPEAEIVSCLLPLGSIFWSDELPPFRFLAFTEAVDRDAVMKLFAVRINYWNTGEMGLEDRSVWGRAQREFPEWPLFRRLELTTAQRIVHEAVQKELENFFDEMSTLGDEVTLSENENGFTSFSATINVWDE
jgi:hypothetical protein